MVSYRGYQNGWHLLMAINWLKSLPDCRSASRDARCRHLRSSRLCLDKLDSWKSFPHRNLENVMERHEATDPHRIPRLLYSQPERAPLQGPRRRSNEGPREALETSRPHCCGLNG